MTTLARLAIPIACLAITEATPLAQNLVTVPAAYSNLEADSRTTIPGIVYDGHAQWILGSASMAHLSGRSMLGLAFRHDANWDESSAAGSGEWIVRIGPATSEPGSAPADFRLNLPANVLTEVYRGTVNFGNCAASANVPNWAATHRIEIPFNTSYAYQGGPLAIEIEGTATVGPTWWSVDAVEDIVRGSSTDIGMSCGGRAFPNGRNASTDESSLVPGSTADFVYFGTPASAAFLLLGSSLYSQPMNLSFLGAPSCDLHVDFFATIPRTVIHRGALGFGGAAQARLPLPLDTTFLDAVLFAQWLEIGNSVGTSQAQRLQLAARLPALPILTIARAADGSIERRAHEAPIFGFLVN